MALPEEKHFTDVTKDLKMKILWMTREDPRGSDRGGSFLETGENKDSQERPGMALPEARRGEARSSHYSFGGRETHEPVPQQRRRRQAAERLGVTQLHGRGGKRRKRRLTVFSKHRLQGQPGSAAEGTAAAEPGAVNWLAKRQCSPLRRAGSTDEQLQTNKQRTEEHFKLND